MFGVGTQLIHVVWGTETDVSEFPSGRCQEAVVFSAENDEEKKPCQICGVYVRDMDHHRKAAHLPEDQKKHKCPECGKGFYYTRELTQHRINNHLKNRPFQCRYGCDIKYNDASNRYSHEKKKHGGLINNVTQEMGT